MMMPCSIDKTIVYVGKELYIKLAYNTITYIKAALKKDAEKASSRS